MRNHTSFKIGGPARFFITPDTPEELIRVVNECKTAGIKYIVIGNGSNLLFPDEGYDGAVISAKGLDSIELVDETIIQTGAGASLAAIAGFALEHNLAGFEFASGIPGSLGGAVTMNAGAYEKEIKDVFVIANVLDNDGNRRTLTPDEMRFGHRTSVIQKENIIVLGAVIGLQKGDKTAVRERMLDLNKRRAEKQPLEMPSAGSTFKRPQGHFAGKLIMDCGLRGHIIGGAQVSEKHCGFIVNRGNATSEDVLRLIGHIVKTVEGKYGIELEPEVRIVKNG